MERQKMKEYKAFIKIWVCYIQKPKFIKQQEASWLLSSLGIKTPLSKTPLVGLLLFWKS